ncbi:uncharacterized protein LOC111071617 [Drosophila obscura]|uniref:uncharacterized protein LOC111071617 n=1 Tax=Drosophila obscura TaxID=7282 RepID=UPI001BB2722E|nr:uncharacterized protein LOC111071617 [Drosophila obscura]
MKKNIAKHLAKSKKMPIHSFSDKLHRNQHQHTQKVLARVHKAFGTRFSDEDLCTAGPPKSMEKSVWSSPQIGGSGGALKALAKNVANHLEQLNRATMKRVVAQVIAERHSLGEVADFKGHMYFARPDHINFTELIAQSKEAFDDLVQQKATTGVQTERPQRTNTSTNTKMKMLPFRPTGGQSSGVGNTGLDRLLTNKSMNARKQAASRLKRFESPVTIFQLDDEGSRSLNGVIIDDSHLPFDRKDILLQVSKRPGGSTRPLKKHRPTKGILSTKPQQPQQSPAKVKGISQTTPSALQLRKSSVRVNRNRETAAGKVQLPAGAYHHPPPAPARGRNKRNAETVAPKLPSKKAKSMSKIGARVPLLQRTYSKPWLVRRTKSHHHVKRAGRLAGGFVVEKKTPLESNVEMAIHGQSKLDSHVAKQIRSVAFPWYTPYQFQGGAGATATATGTQPTSQKGNANKRQQYKKKPSAVTVPAAPKAKSLGNRQSRYNRLQARLIRDLKREEAIDDPERLKSGGLGRRHAKQQQQLQQQDPVEASTRKSRLCSPTRRPAKRPPNPFPFAVGRSSGSPARSAVKSPPRIRRRRSRLVPVDSSLGSFACLRPDPASNKNSKTTLTPAKRHLTIAFFNKRLEERGQKQAPKLPWK